MTDDEQDPLAGAAVGETRTVDGETKTWTRHVLPGDLHGVDREADIRIENAEVVTDEYGDTHVRLEYEADVTQYLPRRWDECNQPRTEREEQAERWSRVRRFAAPVVGGLGSLTIVGLVAHRVASATFSEISINGQAATPPTLAESFGMLAVIVGLALFLLWALQYLPGTAGRRYA